MFAAIERALWHVRGEFDAVASLGGESLLVYALTNGRVSYVLASAYRNGQGVGGVRVWTGDAQGPFPDYPDTVWTFHRPGKMRHSRPFC